MRSDIIFYVLAIIFFIGFVGCLIWYLLDKKQQNTKMPIKWTIESAKKFLEENNAEISKNSNETAVKSTKPETLNSKSATESQTLKPTKTESKTETVKTGETPLNAQTKKPVVTPKAAVLNAQKTQTISPKPPVKTETTNKTTEIKEKNTENKTTENKTKVDKK